MSNFSLENIAKHCGACPWKANDKNNIKINV